MFIAQAKQIWRFRTYQRGISVWLIRCGSDERPEDESQYTCADGQQKEQSGDTQDDVSLSSKARTAFRLVVVSGSSMTKAILPFLSMM